MASCNGTAPLVPYSADPLLYLVLGQRTLVGDQAFDQRALLLTVGSPVYSEYRTASRFEMRRLSDGAVFVWRDMGQRGTAPVGPAGVALHRGNYALPEEGDGSTLGDGDVQPGDTFDLIVDTEGIVITGQVTIPASFSVTLMSSPRRVVWPRVAGAALYSVELRGYRAPAFQADTALILPDGVPGGTEVRVKALDENLARYVSDTLAGRAGLNTGFGVFGGTTSASVVLPESD